ncbi:YhgE/Pip domain-containing protein [Alkalihalobacterium bogoriense]|uniref:YhgE/Pip domain-containing protein n=1 Tax=Alkalihalobacterium bogoriense TaxID=246272 RepID=UPI000479CDB3|nr:YhgE/Pip domain-containing protein [Alkalihalobacterium bogoriense]
MKNIWSIFKQDLLNIKRVPLVGILLIGLAILPSLYAWFNLGAAWDPYANTQGVAVAVVNEDIGAEIDDTYINIGEELIENLSENENLGWTFVSREVAEKGVRYGDYYASIYINETFSHDLVQVLEGTPVQAEVLYEVNEKVNAIAPKMTSAGASTIVKEINDQFRVETSKVIFQEFDKLGVKLEEELPTFRKMKQIVYSLEERLPEVNEFGQWVIALDEDWEQVEKSVEQLLALEDVFPQIYDGAEHIYKLEQQFPRINRIGDGILQLDEAIPEIEQAVGELNQINEHFTQISSSLEEALEKTSLAQETITAILDSLPDVEQRSTLIQDYMEALDTFANEVSSVATPVVDTLAQQLLFINQTASSLEQTLTLLEDEEKAEEAIEALRRLNEELQSHISAIESAIEMYTKLYELTNDEGLVTVIEGLTRMQDVLVRAQHDVALILARMESGEPIGTDRLTQAQDKVKQIEKRSNELYMTLTNDGVQTIERVVEQAQANLSISQLSVEDAHQQLQNLETVLLHAEKITIAGEETIQELLHDFPEIEKKITEMTERIEQDIPVVIGVIESLSMFVKNDLPVLEGHINQVSDLLKEDVPRIEKNYAKLANIVEKNVPVFQSSIKELADFSRKQLPEMEENIGDAADRIREIEKDDRINQIITALRNDLDEESEFFSSPVDLIEDELFPIPNYGSANVPFYTTLSLWVGALLLSNLISTNLHKADIREHYTLRQIYFGRMILFLIVGMLQGLCVSVGNLTILGIYAAHPFLLIVFSIVIAIVFMTIVYTLASILGNIGKALAIVLLVLQLSSGGGTFPIEVAPPFYQIIHPFMPFAYAINLLREAVGGIIPALVWRNLFALACFWVLAIIVGCLLKPLLAARIQETYEKSKSSRLVE